MTVTLAAPVVVAVAGALIYALAGAKPAELGRGMFWMGVLAALLNLHR